MQLNLDTDLKLATAMAAFECCSDAMKALLERDDLMRGHLRMPRDLRQLYERRQDYCDQVCREIADHLVDVTLDKSFAPPAEPPAPAEPPKRSKSQRRRQAVQNVQQWEGT